MFTKNTTNLKKFTLFFTGRIKVLQNLWVIGGEFVKDTGDVHFRLLDPATTFTTRKYQVRILATKEHKSVNPSALGRLRNCLVNGFNDCFNHA